MVRQRSEVKPATIRRDFFACEECGKEYGDNSTALACEKHHVQDRCSHPESARVLVPVEDCIEVTCRDCGRWFDEAIRLLDLPDDQVILGRVAQVIREAQVIKRGAT